MPSGVGGARGDSNGLLPPVRRLSRAKLMTTKVISMNVVSMNEQED
jgi:hypothetical protein